MSLKAKMISLLIVGVVLSISIISILQKAGWYSFDLYLFVAIACYPLAIVFGRGVMLDIFHSLQDGHYRLIKASKPNILIRIVNTVFAAIVFLFVGWIYGTYTAYKKYQMYRSSFIK